MVKSDENRTRGLAFGNQLREFETSDILEICKSEEEAINKINELKNQNLTESINEESMKDEIIKMSEEFAKKVDVLVQLFGYGEICTYLEEISDYYYMSDALEPNELYPKEPDGYFASGDINDADEEDVEFVHKELKDLIRKINVKIKNDINRLDFMKNKLSDLL